MEALQPLRMQFKAEDYMKPFKLSSKCYIWKVVSQLGRQLRANEIGWFTEHPQFKHFFHMHCDQSHRLMGMWMLLLRLTCTEKKRECWFVVNGVPIRYSLKEMALISGLECRSYPANYNVLGSNRFKERVFGKDAVVTYADVEAKMLSMKQASSDRLKVAVLYFLCSIIIGKRKTGPNASPVEPFFLRAVDDLELCKRFPWGRLAFEENMKDIDHMVKNFKGGLGAQYIFPSFVIPLELLAFETIPVLKETYCESVGGAQRECPRMCKIKFKGTSMKGIPISELYETLGSTKDIRNLMIPTREENHMLAEILEEDTRWDDKDDAIVDAWNKILRKGKKGIWFESLFEVDISSRNVLAQEDVPPPRITQPEPPRNETDDMMEIVNGLKQEVAALKARVAYLEDYLNVGMTANEPEPEGGNEEGMVHEQDEEIPAMVHEQDEEIPEMVHEQDEEIPEMVHERDEEIPEMVHERAIVVYMPPDPVPLQVEPYTITDNLYDVVDMLKEHFDEQDMAAEYNMGDRYKRAYARKPKATRGAASSSNRQQVRSPVLTRQQKKKKVSK